MDVATATYEKKRSQHDSRRPMFILRALARRLPFMDSSAEDESCPDSGSY